MFWKRKQKATIEEIVSRYYGLLERKDVESSDILSRAEASKEEAKIKREMAYALSRRVMPAYGDRILILYLTLTGDRLRDSILKLRQDLRISDFDNVVPGIEQEHGVVHTSEDFLEFNSYGLIFIEDIFGFERGRHPNPLRNLEIIRRYNLGTPAVLISDDYPEEFGKHIGYVGVVSSIQKNLNYDKLKGLMDRFVPLKS